MYHSSFERPTDHYDPSIQDIDEQICKLINERKQRSENNPGFPPQQLIFSWAKTYHFYEEFLNEVFSTLLNEEFQKPAIEPKGFLKNIPILEGHNEGEMFYSITSLRQFKNASMVYLNCDRYIPMEKQHRHEYDEFPLLELSIEGDTTAAYECQWQGGSGAADQMTYTYVVSPPLPDTKCGLKLVFKEYKTPLKKESTGFGFVIEY